MRRKPTGKSNLREAWDGSGPLILLILGLMVAVVLLVIARGGDGTPGAGPPRRADGPKTDARSSALESPARIGSRSTHHHLAPVAHG